MAVTNNIKSRSLHCAQTHARTKPRLVIIAWRSAFGTLHASLRCVKIIFYSGSRDENDVIAFFFENLECVSVVCEDNNKKKKSKRATANLTRPTASCAKYRIHIKRF